VIKFFIGDCKFMEDLELGRVRRFVRNRGLSHLELFYKVTDVAVSSEMTPYAGRQEYPSARAFCGALASRPVFFALCHTRFNSGSY